MRNSHKENLFNTLNASANTLNQKKDLLSGKQTFKDCEPFIEKLLILKESALLALAEKEDMIEQLTHKLEDTRNEQLQLSVLQREEEKPVIDLLLSKINQKKQQAENAIEQLKQQEREIQRCRQEMENLEWQKQQFLAQLQRYEVQNQDLRDMIEQLVAENHKIRTNYKLTLLQSNSLQKHSQSVSSNELQSQKDKLQQKEQQNLIFRSDQKLKEKIDRSLLSSRSPPLNILLFERSKSIGQFINTNEEADLVDPVQQSVSGDIKQSTVGRHCLGMSLKAINLIDSYSVNSGQKRMLDCDSQMTARYFQYVNEKDLDARCDLNSVDQPQGQSCEDIAEQTEQREDDLQAQPLEIPREEDVSLRWKWGALGVVIGATFTLLFKS